MSGAPQQSIRHMSSAGDVSALPDMMGASLLPLPLGTQQLAQYVPPTAASFISPSMWQESVASVYEGGLKQQWGYDQQGNVKVMDQSVKRR